MSWPAMRGREDLLLLSLRRDGRIVNPAAQEALRQWLPGTTDCFVFCHGWLNDAAEARGAAERFFARLDRALRPVRERMVPLRLAVHWPSKPFGDPEGEDGAAAPGGAHTGSLQNGADAHDDYTHLATDAPQARGRRPVQEPWPALVSALGDLARIEPRPLASLLDLVCESEVPLGAEEEIELDALMSQLRAGCWAGTERDVASRSRGGLSLNPLHALTFWLMKRRAGQVGERLGREILAPLLRALEDRAPRLHLIGHSFGAKLVASAVLGGLQADSLILLLGAFSAFAFAEEVPGTRRPGAYRRGVTEDLVRAPVVALHSDHDRALRTLYPALTWGGQVDRALREAHHLTQTRERVVRSALGATGALGVGARRFDLLDIPQTGLARGVVNIDGSRVVQRQEWLIGAHRDIFHDEIGTLVAMGTGLMKGGPAGARPRPLSPFGLS